MVHLAVDNYQLIADALVVSIKVFLKEQVNQVNTATHTIFWAIKNIFWHGITRSEALKHTGCNREKNKNEKNLPQKIKAFVLWRR